jgi:hypothetical protein
MDRRFTNVISTVADTALELRSGLAKYWRTRMALVDQDIVPNCTTCAGLARSGARPTRVCAKRGRAGLAAGSRNI